MKVAVNAPFDDLSMNVGTITYGLAHLAQENPDYVRFLKESRKYTILDNAADELVRGMKGEALWSLVEEIRPDELILPDVLKEASATREASEVFYNEFVKDSGIRLNLMAVAQGKTFDEWVESYTYWLDCPFVDVIGIPYDIDFQLPFVKDESGLTRTNRRSMRRALLVQHVINTIKDHKPIHLLGMNNLSEFQAYRRLSAQTLKWIRSNDTTGPFAAAFDGRDWTTSEPDFEKNWPALNFNRKWTKGERELAIKNLLVYASQADDHGMSFNIGFRNGLETS